MDVWSTLQRLRHSTRDKPFLPRFHPTTVRLPFQLSPPSVISLGEGQEPVAIRAMNAAAVNGTWVLLQNCELGLGLMNEMEVGQSTELAVLVANVPSIALIIS